MVDPGDGTLTPLERIRGCLLGGAVGDALGAPVEFLALSEIRRRFGPEGVVDFHPAYGRRGAVTDDSQMTLFTAEGLLRWRATGGDFASTMWEAYQEWLATQGEVSAPPGKGWLSTVPELHSRRGPGHTCLTALKGGRMGSPRHVINDSKGCGGVMRVAPIGAMGERAFESALAAAALTHTHPSGYLAAGALAVMIAALFGGATLEEAAAGARRAVAGHPEASEVVLGLDHARDLVGRGSPSAEAVESLGRGWVAEEALAMAVYCALVADGDFRRGVLLAVNHSGDSDSTASITGQLLGAHLGVDAIPARWSREVELADVIAAVADDLHSVFVEGATPPDRYRPT